jgi:hypothetical protein
VSFVQVRSRRGREKGGRGFKERREGRRREEG